MPRVCGALDFPLFCLRLHQHFLALLVILFPSLYRATRVGAAKEKATAKGSSSRQVQAGSSLKSASSRKARLAASRVSVAFFEMAPRPLAGNFDGAEGFGFVLAAMSKK